LLAVGPLLAASPPEKPRQPRLCAVDRRIGESQEVELSDQTTAEVKLSSRE
jgi:hypothetical protein